VAYLGRRVLVPKGALAKEWLSWSLSNALHSRIACTYPDHKHDEARDADLPRRRWLSVKAAMVTLPKEEWPKR